MSSSTTITKPTKTMSWEEFYDKTDNANKLMDRVWYCIACTEKDVGEQKVFWEHWYWKHDDDDEKMVVTATKDNLKNMICSNHTKTIAAKDDKVIDYPIWPVRFNESSMKMYPAINLGCCVIAPIGLSMKPITFPTNDSRIEFRVDYAEVFGSKMYFVFVLDPHISEENKTKCFNKLQEENGIHREWFHEVQWDKEYVIGSTGEPDINPR